MKKKQSLTVRVSDELLERVRNVVYWTPGTTVNGIVEDALNLFLTSLEEKHGTAFPQRERALQPGRKVEL